MRVETRATRRRLEEELVARGVRMTHQRRLLIQIIQNADGHMDALALWERARAQDPTLNKVTVYRTLDRKSTRLNSSHGYISYAVFCLKKKKKNRTESHPPKRHLSEHLHACNSIV